MTATTLEEFRRELLATGAYATHPDRRAAARHRPSALTTLRFSLAVSRVFPMCAVWQALGRLTTERWAEFCFSTVRMPEKLGMNVILEGWQNRAAVSGPVVYVCNHMSTYETILLPPVLMTYGPIRVVAKASLTHLPFLETAAHKMGLVALGRKDPKADLLALYSAGEAAAGDGASFVIFPQGTRQSVFSRSRFSSIGAKLAAKSGVSLVPLAIDSSCMPTRSKGLLKGVFKDFGPVDTSRDIRLACGPAIACAKARDMHEASFEWIARQLEKWGLAVER